jgi:hypothetical protein
MKILDVTPETPAAKVERLRAELAAAEAAVPRVPEGTTDCLT